MEILGAKWNGEPCKANSVTVFISKVENTPLHWQNDFVGQRIEAIKIRTLGKIWSEFYIENQTGQGYAKITQGEGMWYFGHSSIWCENDLLLEVQEIDYVTKPKE